MKYMYICNLEYDYISKISLNDFKEEGRIQLDKAYNDILRPKNMISHEDKLFIANSYANTLIIVDLLSDKVIGEYYIGANCNDVIIVNKKAYFTCGECDSLIIFDLESNSILERVPCGSAPCHVAYDEKKELIVVTNLGDDSINVINFKDYNENKKISLESYPTKTLINKEENIMVVLQSNMGLNKNGKISIIDTVSMKTIKEVEVGLSPIDIIEEEENYYVANFLSGTIDIIDKKSFEIVDIMDVGGMPKKILKHGSYLYILNCLNGSLIRIDILSKEKRSLRLGGEPSAIVIN